MIDRPARHAIYQRAREIERLSGTLQTERPERYLNESVRRVSDFVAQVAAFPGMDEELQRGLVKKQGDMSRLRQMVAHLVEGTNSASVAVVPTRRHSQK
jgi:hypothetical protein